VSAAAAAVPRQLCTAAHAASCLAPAVTNNTKQFTGVTVVDERLLCSVSMTHTPWRCSSSAAVGAVIVHAAFVATMNKHTST
jgi:hypothetical protein